MNAPSEGSGAAGRVAALVLGPALFFAVLALPLSLSPEAHRLAAVMALVVVFWIGEPIPIAATALLGPTLALLFGAVPGGTPREAIGAAYSKFGDPILMLFIGGLFIAEAMTAHGLDRRLAREILARFAARGGAARVVCALAIASFLLSMWMSNTATTALLLPIAGGILGAARSGGPSRFESAAVLAIAYAATIGGLVTPVGTAPNMIGLSQIESLAGVRIGFVTWMTWALPVALASLAVLLFVLTRRLEGETTSAAVSSPSAPWTRGERVTALSFGLAVALWMASGISQVFPGCPANAWFERHLPEGAIAILAASLLFLLHAAPGRPALTWREAARIDWGTLLLLGGGLSLGDLMLKTGLADAVGAKIVAISGVSSLWALVAVAAALTIALSEIASNTATVAMMLPVVIGIAKTLGVSPLPPALAVTWASSFGCMLPVSTPPNALAYGTGRVPVRRMASYGILLDLAGLAAVVGGLRVLWGFLGPIG